MAGHSVLRGSVLSRQYRGGCDLGGFVLKGFRPTLSQGKFASGVRKYGKFSHFFTHLVVYGGQGKKTNIIFSISTANVYRLSRVKVSGTCVQPFQRYWDFGMFGVLGALGCFGVF